jgi:hypothetical protein
LRTLRGHNATECLDWVIPLNEKHLRRILREWVTHYHRGRPHASLGPGIPVPTKKPPRNAQYGKHQLPEDCRIRTRETFLAGSVMNIGWRNWQLEFRSSFCGAQQLLYLLWSRPLSQSLIIWGNPI